MGSNSSPKTGFQKKLKKILIFSTPVLGAKMEAKAIKKRLQKNIKNMMPNMNPNWSQRGSQNGAKIVKNEVLEASCFKAGSQVASRPPSRIDFGEVLGAFWDHF